MTMFSDSEIQLSPYSLRDPGIMPTTDLLAEWMELKYQGAPTQPASTKFPDLPNDQKLYYQRMGMLEMEINTRMPCKP